MFLCCLGRLRGEVRVCAAGALKKTKQGLSFERGECALRARGLSFSVVWAASGGGRGIGGMRGGRSEENKAGLSFERGECALRARGIFFFCSLGRLRRGQGGAGYGAAPPSRPPLHPPRSTPLGFSRFRHSTRAARLLLRELPRSARRSPCAPRNASVRFRVERGIVRSSH